MRISVLTRRDARAEETRGSLRSVWVAIDVEFSRYTVASYAE